MNRVLTVVVIVAFLAGSVPAAATLADGTPSDSEPGAAFSGMVGVQEAEVTNEVADRSLTNRLNAAETNGSRASVVASETEQLQERLAELESQKEQLKQAYENGSISKGEYQARLAVLGAELRALERQANRTAGVAEKLPEKALRERGANASEVREIAQQANRSGGGEVAEAARTIAGKGVGKGLGNAPNASERGPPTDVGNGGPPDTERTTTDRKPTDSGPPSDAGPPNGAGNDPANASNGTDRGNDANSSAMGSESTGPNANVNGTEPGNADGDGVNSSTGATNDSSATEENGSTPTDETATETDDGQSRIGFGTSADWRSGGLSVDDTPSGLEGALADAKRTTVPGTTLG
ncbi:MAG: hypothetical protein V5A38_07165 [Halolamina sp.]|uniref:DUF7096 domain-containing protein n=1 Tax=Halolamina sp. TaxID=1940283 RepID=UPI002FC32D13